MICTDHADIPLTQLENPKTAESALESLGRSAEELVLEHNLQGLLALIFCQQSHTSLQFFFRATSSLCGVSPRQ